jgi:glycerate 2-kinase
MELRIQNMESLSSHGNIPGRKAMLEILEAGLEAADPYNNIRELIHIDKDRLIVGNKEFEPTGAPVSGDTVIDLNEIDNIYIFGAGKGIQRAAKAIEDVLGERLTGGHIIDKKGQPVILERVDVTLGGHPVPDEDGAAGCHKTIEMTKKLTKRDLVFTCVGSGCSALWTMPAPGLSVEDVRKVNYVMQLEHGASTGDLNPVRNHLDMMLGGRINRYVQPARVIHIMTKDPGDYDSLVHHRRWPSVLPDNASFQQAIDNIKKWDAWEEVPVSVRTHLERADPQYDTVKAEEFKEVMAHNRIFGVRPGLHQTALPAALKKAEELGFCSTILAERMSLVESQQAARVYSLIAKTVEHIGQPLKPPCALLSSGEMTVAIGKETGMGGRNQEFALAAAMEIAGSKNIVMASVDTDGTDGPGIQFSGQLGDLPSCLAGGIVDGFTYAEAQDAGIDIPAELKKHNTSPALWKLKNGILATPNISLLDLTVILVL